ncbi:hypothetical protein ONZ45_g9257 [Pleurotus djamor]|nr:hypothetical protein ONZ45_g9257 [Pleurotus djamor]
MSDDEDEYNENGRLTSRFISRPPTYRSTILKTLYATINVCVDGTIKRQYVERTSGPPKEMGPPKTKLLALCIRCWMVSKDWLATGDNNTYDIPGRIADSGRLWGDDRDPEEIEDEHKKAKEEKEEAYRKRPRVEKGEVVVSKRQKGKGRARDT